ncbi:CsbD family protein [Kitasatospora sp. NPDC005751]|uniref:CsbD family protein n=1 Tax=Kitasatospora sp. NPDC005751 TaxID=3157064 RepID=UPI0033C0B951
MSDTMGADDKLRNAGEKVEGKIKEAAGKATGDRTIEAKGRGEQAKSDLKQAVEKVKDAGKN